MAVPAKRRIGVKLNGFDLRPGLVSFGARVEPFSVSFDVEYLDVETIDFDVCTACANRERVTIELQFGSCSPVAFVGKLGSVETSKSARGEHTVKFSFEGEPV